MRRVYPIEKEAIVQSGGYSSPLQLSYREMLYPQGFALINPLDIFELQALAQKILRLA